MPLLFLLSLLGCGEDAEPALETDLPGDSPPADDSAPHSGGVDDSAADDSAADDTGELASPRAVRGAVSCAQACEGPIVVQVAGLEPGTRIFTVTLDEPGDFELSVPSSLAELVVMGFFDSDGDGVQQVTEPSGGGAALHRPEAGADVEDVELVLEPSLWDSEAQRAGIELADGSVVLPDRVLVVLAEGSSEEDAQALAEAAGATLGWFDADLALADLWLELPGDLDDEADLAALEAAERVLADDSRVLETIRDRDMPGALAIRTDSDDDYKGLKDTSWAHVLARVDPAKDLYDLCSYHFDKPGQRARAVEVSIVDADLNALSGQAEVSSSWAAERDLHKHVPRELWDREGAHGTKACGLIAGVNNGDHGNGFLTGFDGVGGTGAYSVAVTVSPWNVGHGESGTVLRSTDALIGLWSAARDSGRVVNVSFAMSKAELGGNEAWLEHVRVFRRGLGFYQDTLFMLAAGNAGVDIDKQAEWTSYAGFYDNLISVGGTASDQGYGNYSSSGLNVEIAAEANSIQAWRRPWTHDPTGTDSVGAEDVGLVSGTSFAAPQLSAAAGLVLAFDSTRSASSVLTVLRDTADRVGPADRSGRRLNMERLVTRLIGEEINSDVEWLLDLDMRADGRKSTCWGAMAPGYVWECLPLEDDTALASVAGVDDMFLQTYTIAGTLHGTSDGDKIELKVTGDGVNLGFDPHTTDLVGTVKGSSSLAAGDLELTGTFEGGPDDKSCAYEGTFTGTLRRVRRVP